MPTKCPTCTRLSTAHTLRVKHSEWDTAVPTSRKPGETQVVLSKAHWPALLFSSSYQAVHVPKAFFSFFLSNYQVTVPPTPPLREGSSYIEAEDPWLCMGLLVQFIGNEPGPGLSLRSNVCLISQVPPSESKWQVEPVSVESFLRSEVRRLLGKSNNRCGQDAVTSGSSAFSADDWGGPLPNSSFWKANLNSGLFPGKVSAFMSPAGSDANEEQASGVTPETVASYGAAFLPPVLTPAEAPSPAQVHTMHCKAWRRPALTFANALACGFGDWKLLEQGKLRRIGSHSAYSLV